ncbi:MAG: hypothetical protein QW589_00610 [Candidatus Bathyarchaeia archaeon]
MSEEAFREGLKGLFEKVKIDRLSRYNESKIVYRHPIIIELDIAIHDE